MNKKICIWILIVLLVLQFPITIFLASAKSAAFDIDFYEKEFNKYNPNVTNSVSITENLIYYLRYREADEKHIAVFEQDEIDHLIDVKVLIHRFLLILNLTMLAAVIFAGLLFFIDKNNFLKNLGVSVLSGGFFTLLIGFISYSIINDFDKAFVKFHELFFKIGTWSFPSTYKLVTLFPGEFWADIIDKIMANFIISANILILAGFILLFVEYKTRGR